MECNRRNRNMRYVIFRDLNFKKLSEYLILQSYIFLYFLRQNLKTKKVIFPVFGTHYYFSHFWQICQKEMPHFFENGSMAEEYFSISFIPLVQTYFILTETVFFQSQPFRCYQKSLVKLRHSGVFFSSSGNVYISEILDSGKWKRIFGLVETIMFCSEDFPPSGSQL